MKRIVFWVVIFLVSFLMLVIVEAKHTEATINTDPNKNRIDHGSTLAFVLMDNINAIYCVANSGTSSYFVPRRTQKALNTFVAAASRLDKITINEGSCSVQVISLTISEDSISEVAYKSATVTAELNKIPDLDVTIDLRVTGTAIPGSDYNMPLKIVIPKGSKTGSIIITPIEDLLDEGVESVSINISSVKNGEKRGNPQDSISIYDE